MKARITVFLVESPPQTLKDRDADESPTMSALDASAHTSPTRRGGDDRRGRGGRIKRHIDNSPKRSVRCRRLHVVLVVVVLVLAALAAPALASTIDFESLTWDQWSELHDTSAAALALERVYRESPRVRAKLRVAKQLSMNQFLAGDAIFRQQLSEVVGTSAARVQLEFLQTSALRESEQGEVFAAFGISALPDPTSQPALPTNGSTIQTPNNSAVTIGSAIDQERERIIERLRYGGMNARGLNATISDLSLFGVAAALVDVVLDGEVFYPIDMKPWVAARIAVVPSVLGRSNSNGTNPPNGVGGGTGSFPQQQRYLPSRDAYQSLRLRFLIAKALRSLQVVPSDILLRDSAPPFASYYSDAATVIEAEIHMSDERFRTAVDGYLRNASLAHEFNALEPQWRIAAIDVDARSGVLYSPPSGSTLAAAAASSAAPNATALEVTFALENVSFTYVDSYKWRILEQFALFAQTSGCSDCQVSYARVTAAAVAPSATDEPTNTRSDGDADAPATLDPINARSISLVFSVDTAHNSLAPGLFSAFDTHITAGASTTLCELIGIDARAEASAAAAAAAGSSTCTLVMYQNTSSQPRDEATEEPFVQLNLKLALTTTALAASTPAHELAASVFAHYRVRCVLLVLLQQVAVLDEHVQFVSSTVLADQDKSSLLLLLTPPVQLVYRVAIRDESQRRGIALHFLSKRFELTVFEYTQHLLQVVARVADLHADGSPSIDDKLPGFALPPLNMTAALAPSPSSIDRRISIYRFEDPMPATSATTLNVADPPRCAAATNASASLVCISIHFTSAFESDNAVFLRQITSNAELSSPSLVLPPRSRTAISAATAEAAPPAPWIERRADASVPWIIYAILSPTSSSSSDRRRSVVLRFHFEFVASMDVSEIRRQTSFLVDVRVEPDTTLGGSSSNNKLVVRKDSSQPLVVGGRALVDANPFVTERLPEVNTTNSTLPLSAPLEVALTIHRSSVGGFFTRDISSQCTACSSALQQCDSSIECKALAACVGAYASANPTLYASLLRVSSLPQATNATVSLDTTWTLQQCVYSEQRWNSSTLALFLGGLQCVSTNRCAVATLNATATAPRRSVVLRHSPLEQTLAFARENFTATLLFRVDILDSDDGVGTTKSETFSNLTLDDASLSALSKTLMQLYGYDGRAGYGDGLLTSFVNVSRDITSSGDTVLRIRYFSLSLWDLVPSASASVSSMGMRELPVIRSLAGDAPRVAVTQSSEQLELLVIDDRHSIS